MYKYAWIQFFLLFWLPKMKVKGQTLINIYNLGSSIYYTELGKFRKRIFLRHLHPLPISDMRKHWHLTLISHCGMEKNLGMNQWESTRQWSNKLSGSTKVGGEGIQRATGITDLRKAHLLCFHWWPLEQDLNTSRLDCRSSLRVGLPVSSLCPHTTQTPESVSQL